MVGSPGGVHIGCCGFAAAMHEYVRRFDTVEIQQTFYEPPRRSTAERWRAGAPPAFLFSLKAWQLITHEASSPTYRRLHLALDPVQRELVGSFKPTEEVWKAWLRTRDIAKILSARVIVFQCPATFEPTPKNKSHMRMFFSAVRKDVEAAGLPVHLAWEPRGEWRPQEVRTLCEDLGLIHVVDPFRHEPVTQEVFYVRLHGTTGYRHRYTDEELERLRAFVANRPEGFCLFNNISMKEDAIRFRRILGMEPGD